MDNQIRKLTSETTTNYPSNSAEPTFAYPLSSWTYHYKLQQIRQLLQLGFELDIYAPDEIPGIYWYISYICQTHSAHLDRMAFFADETAHARGSLPASTRFTKATLVVAREAAVTKSLTVIGRSTKRLQAIEAFSAALHALYVLLARLGFLSKPSRPYSSDEMRYELRMKPLFPLALPEIVPWTDFERESAARDQDNRELLERAIFTITRARRLWEDVLNAKWSSDPPITLSRDVGSKAEKSLNGSTSVEDEWTKDVKNTLKACIGTSVALATLKKQLAAEGLQAPHARPGRQKGEAPAGCRAHIPRPGQKGCWHDWWLVPKINA